MNQNNKRFGWGVVLLRAALLLPCAAGAQDETLSAIALPVTQESAALPTVIVEAPRYSQAPAALSSGLAGASYTQPLSLISYSIEELMALGARDRQQALETSAAAMVPVDYQAQPKSAYTLRGFNAEVLRDGFPSFGGYGDRDSLIGLSRIDFIKGPGSSLNAGALGLPPGGAVNLHTRWAGTRREALLAYTQSRYAQREAQLLLDSGDLLDVVSLSLAAEDSAGGGFFDWARLEHRLLRPGLSLRGFGGRMSFYYEESWRRQKDYPGLPTTGTLDRSAFTIADSRSVMDPDVPLSQSSVHSYGLDGALPLGDWLDLQAAARHGHSRITQRGQYLSSNDPSLPLLAPSSFQRLAATYDGETVERQARARLSLHNPHSRIGDHEIGRWQGWLDASAHSGPDRVEMYSGLASAIDLADPRYTSWREPQLPFQSGDTAFRVRNLGGGLQWRYAGRLNSFYAATRSRARIGNRQESLGGLSAGVDRVDHYDLIARQYGLAARLWDADSDQPEQGLWLFYGHGNGQQFHAYFAGDASPQPELSDQREWGLRLINSDWGRIEAARFHIRRRNVPTLNPDDPTGLTQVTTGVQAVQGYDLESAFSAPYPFWDRFTLNASAAWLHARLEQDNRYPAGNRLRNVPTQRWRTQLSAQLLREPAALSAFVRNRCQSAVAGDLANSFRVPGSCLQDAGATLGLGELSLDFTLNNLGDRHYYEPYTYLFYGVIPGEARVWRLSLSYHLGN